ncbi:hypothetical protein [Corallococcus sp. Z5C101001]|uniref:hypothetical protein n=1 Tax=Corallococcus sp. Z5C101001 TaxID=2596829 RepID=UPI00117E4AD6|nr:hypothetical protein [Corallococcus sp. Z5C101001]TSC33662.1 hypothetical protein FOF48_00995 [Corallococcus sp. Z5C101001]
MCRACIAPGSNPGHCRTCGNHLRAAGLDPSDNRSSIGEYLAQCSWLTAFLTSGAIYFWGFKQGSLVGLLTLTSGFLLGLGCGLFALRRERDRRLLRVLVPAIIGIVLNGLPWLATGLLIVLPASVDLIKDPLR